MQRRSFCMAALGATLPWRGELRAAGLKTIQVGLSNFPGMSPFYVALERGYFRNAGIDAQPQMLGRNMEIVALLAAGRLDAAINPVGPSLFNVASRGSEVRVVLGRERVTLSCGVCGSLYARKAAFPKGTSSIQEWSGKNIWAGQGAGLGEFLLDTILSRSHVDPKRVQRPRLNQAQAAAALVSGAIDGMLQANNGPLEFPPEAGIVREEAGMKIIAGLQTSHILFGAGLIHGDVTIGSKFLAAYLRGVADFEAGVTPQFLKDMAQSQGNSQTILTQCRRYSTPNGSIDRASIALARDWAVGRGYTEATVTVDSVVDERFLELAKREMQVVR